MRDGPSPARLLGAGVVLAGPTALAFFSGGFFNEARLWAGVSACALVIAVALFARPPLPRSRRPLLALTGLALLTLLTGLSALWSPALGSALDDAQRVVLYLAGTVAAVALLRPRALARAAEPALALGISVVMGYGLSERLFPGLVHLHGSISAGGRLEQPITYWNAMGALAAMGIVLCARLAGDETRPPPIRGLFAAAATPLAAGLYLTFSRGALAALVAGAVVVLLLAPSRAQVRAVGVCALLGAPAAAAAAILPGLRQVHGALHTREVGGLSMLAVLLVACAAAATLQRSLAQREREGRILAGRLTVRRWAPVALVCVGVAAAGASVAVSSSEKGKRLSGATATRLGSTKTNRYAYWRVAVHVFADHPLAGVGSSGFAVDWLRRRHIRDVVHDAHSLYLETAAELGLAGLFALGLFLGGTAACALTLRGRDPELVPGLAAVVATWAVASALDWHWEMPAVTLPALAGAAALIARADVLEAEEPAPAAEETLEATAVSA